MEEKHPEEEKSGDSIEELPEDETLPPVILTPADASVAAAVVEIPTVGDSSDPKTGDQPGVQGQQANDANYCAISEAEKRWLMMMASFAGMISPFASTVYYPAIPEISRDLGVSISLVTLTISTYLIFQGLAPSITAAVSETHGRRPAYLGCFVLFIAANIGLALQNDYAALLVLRCLQSSGSSGTVAIGSGIINDMVTRAERGKYTAFISLGVTLGPAFGPVIGGLLSHYLGWRSIFWFLLILSSVVGVVVATCMRETNRSIVGNGSVPPQSWNRSPVQIIQQRLHPEKTLEPDTSTLQKRKTRVNPFSSILVLRNRENFFIILYVSLQFAGYNAVVSTLSSQLDRRYHLSEVDIGLCYLPLGLGSLTSRWTVGYLVDWNFRREAKKQGLPIIKNKNQDISNFNTEKARLTILFPLMIGCACFVLAYGWAMEYHAPLPVILVIIFFTGNVIAGVFVCISALVVDINRDRPASTAAAANLMRCLLAAGATALATPVIDAIGIGWAASVVILIWLTFSPLLVWTYRSGLSWRQAQAARRKEKEERAR